MCKGKKNHGVITILISLLLVGVLSVGTLCIEAGRYQAAKTQLAESNISASTSMIAAYDADLYARYGLLAIDTERFTPERAIDYLNFNADQATGYRGNRLSRLYVVDSVEITGLYNLTYPTILKRQILYNAKYNVVPQDYALNIYNFDTFMENFYTKCAYVSDRLEPTEHYLADVGTIEDVPVGVRNALVALEETFSDFTKWDEECDVTLSESSVALLPSVTGTVEANAPQEDIRDIRTALNDAITVLGGVAAMLDYTQRDPIYNDFSMGTADMYEYVLEESHVDFSLLETPSAVHTFIPQYANAVALLGYMFDSPTYVFYDDAQKEDDILLNAYIVDNFSNRTNRLDKYFAPQKGTSIDGTMENATFASACVEYVLGGSEREWENQEFSYRNVQCICMMNNLYALMTESESFDENNMYSVAAHMIWAYYESLIDTELMIQYGAAVPFDKDRMILPVNNATEVAEAFADHNMENALEKLGIYEDGAYTISGSNALSYKDCLMLGLFYADDKEKLLRIADLIQLETRYYEQYVDNKTATFMMANQNTYCRIKCVGKFNAVLPMLSLDSGNSARGIEFQSIKYAGY